jgi:hypothetical protein
MNYDRSFSDILDEAIARISQGESVDAVLADYPTQATELRDEIEAADFFRSAFAFVPDADRKRAARLRMHEAIERKSRRRLNLSALIPRGLFATGSRIAATLAIGIIVLAGSGTGTVYASRDSAPGDLLYPIKRTGENVQLALAFSEDREVELLDRFISRRIDEMAIVTAAGKEQFIADLVHDLVDYSTRAQEIVAAPVQDAIASLPVVADPPITGAGDDDDVTNITPIGTPEPAPTPTPVDRDPDVGPSAPPAPQRGSSANVSVISTLRLAGDLEQIGSRLIEIEDLVAKESSREILKDVREQLNTTLRDINAMLRRADQVHAPEPPVRPAPEQSDRGFTFSVDGRVTVTVQDVVLIRDKGTLVAVKVDVVLDDGTLLAVTIERGGTRLLKNGRSAGVGQIRVGQVVVLGVEATTGEVTALNILQTPATRQRENRDDAVDDKDARSQSGRSANAGSASNNAGRSQSGVN